jgi:hypothetical protein
MKNIIYELEDQFDYAAYKSQGHRFGSGFKYLSQLMAMLAGVFERSR